MPGMTTQWRTFECLWATVGNDHGVRNQVPTITVFNLEQQGAVLLPIRLGRGTAFDFDSLSLSTSNALSNVDNYFAILMVLTTFSSCTRRSRSCL